jgi:DnaD/phage-associated family protein
MSGLHPGLGPGGFQGFPARVTHTPVPNLFFTLLLPQMRDLAEVKVTLHILWLLAHRRTYPRFVTFRELRRDENLLSGLRALGEEPEVSLRRGLDLARERGTLLQLVVEGQGGTHELYFLNSERDRQAISRIERGEVDLGQIGVRMEEEPPQRANIFALYEENIGLLTPMVAEELKEAEKAYPPAWIEDAFREAVELNRRSWRYISRILERWAREGKGDGKHQRDTKGDIEPNKYLRGKYAHIVKH